MTGLPAPLTPPECNLQDFAFMPLDVARLRDSDLAANETPESCWAAVLLWAASWHQVPAASIPNDDRWIAKQAGYANRGKVAKEWPEIKRGALRGWVECADSRLYHPVVASKAREAWKAKLEQRWRSECARIKKHNERHPGADVEKPTFEEWMSQGCPFGHLLPVPRDKAPSHQDKDGDMGSKGQGEGQGQGQLNSVPNGTGGGAAKRVKTPAELAKAELWKAAVSILEGQAMPEPQARAFFAKLAKEYPDGATVTDAVRNCIAEQPADARSWLTAECQRLSGTRASKTASTRHAGFSNLNYREGVNADGSLV